MGKHCVTFGIDIDKGHGKGWQQEGPRFRGTDEEVIAKYDKAVAAAKDTHSVRLIVIRTLQQHDRRRPIVK